MHQRPTAVIARLFAWCGRPQGWAIAWLLCALAAPAQLALELAEANGNADFYSAAGSRIMDLYRDRIESRSQGARVAAEARLQDRLERDLRLRGLKAERRAIVDSARAGDVGALVIAAHDAARHADDSSRANKAHPT